MRHEACRKILYLGWLGHGNLGDEVLFEIFKRCAADYLHKRPLPMPVVINHYLQIRRYRTSMNQYDLVVLGGGSLLHENYWLNVCDAAMDAGVPVVTWGTGLDGYYNSSFGVTKDFKNLKLRDQFQEKALYRSVSRTTRRMHYVTVRGPLTKEILCHAGVDESKVLVLGDPGFLYQCPLPARSGDLGQILVNWGRCSGAPLNGNDFFAWLKLRTALVGSLRTLIRHGYRVTLYPAWNKDSAAVKRLGRKLGLDARDVIGEVPDAYGVAELISGAGVTVNLRLHASILSGALERPFVSLGYRGKYADFATAVGLEDCNLMVSDDAGIDILGRIQSIMSRYEIIRGKLAVEKALLAARMETVLDTIIGLLEPVRVGIH